MKPQIQETFVVEARPENLTKVLEAVETLLEEADFSPKAVMQTAVAAEEVFVNICHYAGVSTAEVQIRIEEGNAEIRFSDEGPAFNPLEAPPPDFALPPDERPAGGLGIHMAIQLTDSLTYLRDGDRNILTLVKIRKEDA